MRSLGRSVLPVLVLAWLGAASVAAQVRGEPKRVLLMFSSDSHSSPQSIVEEALRSTFQNGSPDTIEFFSEHLDFLRTSLKDYEKELVDLLRQKYKGKKFDLIVTVFGNPLRLVLKHQAELFGDTPVVFVELDRQDIADLTPGPNVTGVWSEVNFTPNLELALRLQPGTKQVVIVSGVNPYDKYLATRIAEDFRAYEGRVTISSLTGLPIPDLQKELAQLPEHTIVYYLSYSRDRAGNAFYTLDVLRQISPVSSAPIFGLTDAQLGLGIVGGSLLSFEALGAGGAKSGLRILAGEKPKDIAPHGVENVTLFDWRELKRWGISEKSLPAGSIVRFRIPSFWDEYRWYIIGSILLMVFQSALITGLVVNRSRRQHAEVERARFASMVDAERRRLNELILNVPGIVWESAMQSDADSRRAAFVSQYAEQLLGYSVEEWLSTPGFAQSIVYEEDREAVARSTSAVLESGKESTFQFRWVAKDGRLVWAEAHLTVMRDETGKIVGLRGVTTDITDRKLAEELLVENEAKLAGIVGSAMDAIVSIDKDQRIILFNAAAQKMFGCAESEAIGQTLDRFIPEHLRESHHEHVRAFGEALVTRRLMGSLGAIYGLRADGEQFPIEASISHLELQGQKFYTVILRDITERQQAVEALRESEGRFRNMADTAPVMIWMSGADKLCTYFNQQWLDFTGRAIQEELGNGWAEGVHPDDYEACLATYNSAFDRREPFTMEYRRRRADGRYRWLYDSGIARFLPGGEFRGYIGSCIDITDRRQAQEELQRALAEVSELKDQLHAENIYLQEEIKLEHNFSEIIGQSDALKYILYKIEQVAPTDSTVLLLGETGTGKELAARAIHDASSRRNRPLLKINCAVLPASLIENELFGHEKGAFTGANARKEGRFELAHGATLFLDEIGELPLELQSRLLRVLQEGEFERLGGSKTIKTDVRIIAATNRNMKLEVQKGHFREDLWFRLNIFPITLPPLRQRMDDIPLLVNFFARRFSKKMGKPIISIAPAAMRALQDYSWPGNIRELANVMERAVINTEGPVLHLADKLETAPTAQQISINGKSLAEMERDIIYQRLVETDWKIEGPNGAAQSLGLNPSTLRLRMTKLGIRRPDTHT